MDPFAFVLAVAGALANPSALPVEATAEPLSSPVAGDCTFKGHKLWGKIKIVDSFADVKVKVVSSFEDLRVKKVDSFADSCGRWQLVDSFPDLTVQIVDSFADFTIEYVDSFPGLP